MDATSPPSAPETEKPSLGKVLRRGFLGRCPQCGQGALFRGFLEVTDRCESCGLEFHGHDAGDGPAVAVTFILGFGVVGLGVFIELTWAPPFWVHAVVATVVTVGGSIAMLRPLKGITVGLQHRYRAVDEPNLPGGQ